MQCRLSFRIGVPSSELNRITDRIRDFPDEPALRQLFREQRQLNRHEAKVGIAAVLILACFHLGVLGDLAV
jgi:hypothetical protein